MTTADWTIPTQRCLGAMVFAAKQPTTTSVENDLFLMLMCTNPDQINFVLPEAPLSGKWRLVFDTARPEHGSGRRPIRVATHISCYHGRLCCCTTGDGGRRRRERDKKQ
ncbi:MAG: hypothetical protein HWD60_06960 [Defluviicoccus sp.]|nr:MAG: hypothetical protein HWD60_06960 [Defluviicoccus sp.]